VVQRGQVAAGGAGDRLPQAGRPGGERHFSWRVIAIRRLLAAATFALILVAVLLTEANDSFSATLWTITG
jgi:hypothetical protein